MDIRYRHTTKTIIPAINIRATGIPALIQIIAVVDKAAPVLGSGDGVLDDGDGGLLETDDSVLLEDGDNVLLEAIDIISLDDNDGELLNNDDVVLLDGDGVRLGGCNDVLLLGGVGDSLIGGGKSDWLDDLVVLDVAGEDGAGAVI